VECRYPHSTCDRTYHFPCAVSVYADKSTVMLYPGKLVVYALANGMIPVLCAITQLVAYGMLKERTFSSGARSIGTPARSPTGPSLRSSLDDHHLRIRHQCPSRHLRPPELQACHRHRHRCQQCLCREQPRHQTLC